MHISDLIKKLIDVKSVHGDIEIQHREPGYAWEPASIRVKVLVDAVVPHPEAKRFISIEAETS